MLGVSEGGFKCQKGSLKFSNIHTGSLNVLKGSLTFSKPFSNFTMTAKDPKQRILEVWSLRVWESAGLVGAPFWDLGVQSLEVENLKRLILQVSLSFSIRSFECL